ncbi:hypothetical protein Tco_0415567 [Tanacetum coccineum]
MNDQGLLNKIRPERDQELNVKAISRNPRPCYDYEHGSSESIRNQASGEIASLKISSQIRKLVSRRPTLVVVHPLPMRLEPLAIIPWLRRSWCKNQDDKKDGHVWRCPSSTAMREKSRPARPVVLVETLPRDLHSSLRATRWFFKRLVAYAKCNRDSYERGMVEILRWWMLLEEADLEHGLEHVVSSYYRANPGESSVLFLLLFLNFYFFNCTIGTLYKPSEGMGVDISLD